MSNGGDGRSGPFQPARVAEAKPRLRLRDSLDGSTRAPGRVIA
jgi:hypothetical protein